MELFVKAVPYRLLLGALFAGIVWWTGAIASAGEFPTYYYVVVVLVYLVYQVLSRLPRPLPHPLTYSLRYPPTQCLWLRWASMLRSVTPGWGAPT